MRYVDCVRDRNHLHICLEYMDYGSLDSLRRRVPFAEALCAVYVSQVVEGLVYLHDQGVLHRDVKCPNILASKDGSVKLADFGVAIRSWEAKGATSDSADDLSIAGSPYWMAPEVRASRKKTELSPLRCAAHAVEYWILWI